MVEVLSKDLYNDIRKIPEFINDLDSSSELAGKKCIVKMKEIMEQEQKVAMKEVNCYKVLKKNQVAFSSVNAAQSPPSPSRKNGKPVLKPSQDGHDCKKLKTCNEKWGGLGCVLIYKLVTVKERREHFKKLKLCFCCGLSFHGVPWKNDGRNSLCNWDSKLDPVKCQGDQCEKGAATCLEHAEKANATEELKAWLKKNNVSTTLNTAINFFFRMV